MQKSDRADPKNIVSVLNGYHIPLRCYSALTLAVDARNFAMAKCLIDAGASLTELESCYNKFGIVPTERIQFKKLWELKDKNKDLPLREQIIGILKCNMDGNIFSQFLTSNSSNLARTAFIKMIAEIRIDAEEDNILLRSICNEHKQHISEFHFKFILECILYDETDNNQQLTQTAHNSF